MAACARAQWSSQHSTPLFLSVTRVTYYCNLLGSGMQLGCGGLSFTVSAFLPQSFVTVQDPGAIRRRATGAVALWVCAISAAWTTS